LYNVFLWVSRSFLSAWTAFTLPLFSPAGANHGFETLSLNE
jgi:hypothetical protein